MITRDNYEEYFLMYVDEELSPAEKIAVEAFVQLHPDLKDELDLLGSTKLPSEVIAFEDKELLLADSMKTTALDETLLLYVDNELPQAEAKKIETQLASDAILASQHQLLLKTKFDPADVVSYPNKKELYRYTERRIVPVWLRVAAAVLLITGGTALWLNQSPDATGTVAFVTPQKVSTQTTTPSSSTTPQTTTSTTAETPTVKTTSAEVAVATPAKAVDNEKVARRTTKRATTTAPETFSKPHTEVASNTRSNNLPVAHQEEMASLDVAKKIKPALNKTDVTNPPLQAYVSVDATAKTTVPVAAVSLENNDEKSGGSVKGFLRKATRFIERRTGIKAVNDDNELLVGAVAVKL